MMMGLCVSHINSKLPSSMKIENAMLKTHSHRELSARTVPRQMDSLMYFYVMNYSYYFTVLNV